MHFTKISVLALAGMVAANASNQDANDIGNAVKVAYEASITQAPRALEERDIGDIISSAKDIAESAADDASTWVDGVRSKAGSVYSDVASHVSTAVDGAETKFSDVASHVSTAVSGAETWLSTKLNAASSAVHAASSAVDSAANAASSAANDDGNAATGLHSGKAGAMAVALALGATAFGFFLI